jgi:uncharacterized glyoxalase superfamily protein PhnB
MKRFNSLCIISRDVPMLRAFYQQILKVEANGDDTFVTFPLEDATLSLCSAQVMEDMSPGSTQEAGYGGAVLEFEVGDVDAEYQRLISLGAPIVKPPTTQPWGLRSVWFRDPQGNIVNFFAQAAQSKR